MKELTEEEFLKASMIKKEIDDLEYFIKRSKKTRGIGIIKRDIRYILKSLPYGILGEKNIEINSELKEKIIDTLEQHLKGLKEELKQI